MNKDSKPEHATLRQQAESLLSANLSKSISQLSAAEVQKLIHELEVHQIELKLQNDELILAKEQSEIASAKYTELYDFAPSGYFTLSKEGAIIELNLAGAKMLGKNRAQLRSKLFMLYINDFSKPAYAQFLERVVNTKTLQTCEAEFTNDSNTPVYIHLTGVASENSSQCFITATDITGLKQAEELLKETSHYLNSLIEYANAPIITWDTNSRITRFNPAFEALTAYSAKEVTGEKLNILFPQESLNESLLMIKLTSSGGSWKSVEIPIRRKDGETRIVLWNSANVLANDNATIIATIAQGQDITERKQAEEALRTSEAIKNKMVSNIGDVIVIIDQNGITRYKSPNITTLFGWQPEELVGKSTWDTIHPDDLDAAKQFIAKLAAEPNATDTLEMRHKRKEGNYVWIEIKVVNLLHDGDIHGFLGNYHDITERKKNEEKNLLWTSILEYSQDFIGLATTDQKAFYVNAAGQKMVGIESDEVAKNTKIEDYFFPEDLPFLNNTIMPTLMRVGRWVGEFRFRHFKTYEPVYVYYDLFLTEDPVTKKIINIATITRDITEWKKAQHELIEAKEKAEKSEERYALVIDASEQGIWDWNLETNEVYFSEQWKKQIGYSDDELKNDFSIWVEHLHPEERENWQNAVSSYIKQPVEHFILDFRLRHKDGTYRWIHNKAACIKNAEGKVIRLFGTHTDNTESKHREAIFRDIIEKNPMSIQILDMEGYPIQVNSAHTKLFGVEPPSNYSIFKDTQLLSLGFGKFFERIKNGEVVYFPDSCYNVHEVDPSFPDSPVWVKALGFTLNDINGNPNEIVLMHENITERKNADALVHEIIENNPMSIQIVDKEGHTVKWNPAFINLFGSVPPPGFSIFDDLRSKGNELGNIVSLILNGNIVHFPDLYFNPHDAVAEAPDTPSWVRAVAFPLNNSTAKPERFVFMHENITERKMAEQALILAKEKAQESESKIASMNTELEQRIAERTIELTVANKELEAFSYSIAHNLRSPLRGINGYAQLLMDDYTSKIDDEGKRFCTTIQTSAVKMGILIDDLLAFSRITRLELQRLPLNMHEMVTAVYSETTSQDDMGRIDFQIGDLCPAEADPSLLKEVWANLISNAVKYSSKKEKATIIITSKVSKKEIIYSIQDNGVGFNVDLSNKLFGVFQRLHSAKEFDGTGVGLAIVKRIIERHGGRVWAEGKVNEGATFYFSLPDNQGLRRNS